MATPIFIYHGAIIKTKIIEVEWIDVNIKQKSNGVYAKKKYSEIKDNDAYVNAKSPQKRADWTVGMLLANGYAIMDGYAINEVLKTIRTLRELGIEYTMKAIQQHTATLADKKFTEMYYEFTTVFFEDDRK